MPCKDLQSHQAAIDFDTGLVPALKDDVSVIDESKCVSFDVGDGVNG
jgi:hypothetical protein